MADPVPPASFPPAPWRVERSRIALADRWIRVRADRCVTGGGVVLDPFYVLDYPDFVQVVAIDDADHIILVEQYRHGFGTLSLELPAGMMEAGDVDPVATAARELAEETGYGSDRWSHGATMACNPATHTNRCHTILAEQVTWRAAPTPDPGEELRTVRMPVAEVVAAAMSGRIVNAMHVASLAVCLTRLGRWHA